MNTKETLSLTYSYRFFHLFPSTGAYKRVMETLDLKTPFLSSFLLAIRRREGRGGLLLANLAFALVTFVISILMDVYIPKAEINGKVILLIYLVYTLILSLKFGFIRLNTFKSMGEMIFTVLCLLFTGYFTLTLLLILVVENAEALSVEEV